MYSAQPGSPRPFRHKQFHGSQLLIIIAAVVLVGCVPKHLQKTKAIPIEQAVPPTAKAPDNSIDRLAWLTGSWQGPVNGGLLEEIWLPPKANTISALVRFTKNGRTEFVEIIKIEKVGNSFELRLQLYDPPMRPRSEKPHVFKLSTIEKNKIIFQGISKGSHRKLSYERVALDHFIIHFQTNEGQDVKINLSSPPKPKIPKATQPRLSEF